MTIKDFELFHGAVLTRIARQNKDLTLRMIETQPSSAWGLYRVDDKANLLIKHSKSPERLNGHGRKWPFTISENQMEQLDLGQMNSSGTHVALVCGDDRLDGDGLTGVCLLDPGQLAKLLTASGAGQQGISVSLRKRKSFRVWSHGHGAEIVVPRNRLEKWA